MISNKDLIKRIPFNSVLVNIEDIEKRNEAFHGLPNESKRQEIMYDLLSIIFAEKVTGSDGCFWSNELMEIYAIDSLEFQKILLNQLPTCQVCVRGGAMLSQIRLGNKIGSDEIFRDEGRKDIIEGFDYVDFSIMEEEYENKECGHPYESNSTEKLANIACNVINNGNFDTRDYTDYLILWNIEYEEEKI